jgi:predicted short-subunit dehydrogenase-like oxidoreductase (DUF2520 family)
MERLNILGCGKAGRALARLFVQHALFEIGQIGNRSAASSAQAVAFVGAGSAAPERIAAMAPAPLWLIGTGDDAIAPTAQALAASGVLRAGDIVFHVSGATPSAALSACAQRGALTASVHPVKNFSDPAVAAQTFAGTWCGCEGEAGALAVLEPAFEALGARLFRIDARYKALYHGGGAFACNFIPVLMELAMRCEERAGIARETALVMFEPIARETLDAVFRQGIAPAFAGPISRGDAGSVRKHLAAMAELDPRVSALYAGLGEIGLDLVGSLGRVEPARIEATRAAMRSLATAADSTDGSVPNKATR